jgi:hypothetical protein
MFTLELFRLTLRPRRLTLEPWRLTLELRRLTISHERFSNRTPVSANCPKCTDFLGKKIIMY